MATVEPDIDTLPYTDLMTLGYPPQFAAAALGVSPQTLKNMETEYGIEISRVARGSVEVRSYTAPDIFKIARLRREAKLVKGFTRPITIADYVQKGGTAKTTTTCNLGIQFSLMGLKTLIIDNDPQADVSTMLGYDPDQTPEDLVEMGVPADRAIDGHLGCLMHLNNFFTKTALTSFRPTTPLTTWMLRCAAP
jgi:chromosome partitioning protein